MSANLGAFFSEHFRRRLANTRARARHNRNFVFESHFLRLLKEQP
jgi:hypothetical protein